MLTTEPFFTTLLASHAVRVTWLREAAPCFTPSEIFMAPTNAPSQFCLTPNYFSSVLTPAVQSRLPDQGSIQGRVVDYLTNVGPFFQTVSQDLCDDGRMGIESTKSATSFIARSATTAAVAVGTTSLAITGAVLGSPLIALGLGAAGLVVLPYVAEKAVFRIADFAGELLNGVKKDSL